MVSVTMASIYTLLGILYLVQGFPYGLQSGLFPVVLRTQGLSLSHIGLTKILYLPWLLKFLWSPLVDGWLNRRTWLLLSTGGLCLCCLLCSLLSPAVTVLPVVCLLFLMHILSSLQDVAVDAVSVAVLTHEQVGLGNSLQVVAYKIGSVLAGGGALTLLDTLGWRAVFLLLAGMYLLAVLSTARTKALVNAELAPEGDHNLPARCRTLKDIVYKVFAVPGTVWTGVYVLTYKLGEQGSLSMIPLLLLDAGVSAAELGVYNGIISVGFSVAGSALGGTLLSRGRSLQRILSTLLFLRTLCLVFQTILLSVLGKDFSTVRGENQSNYISHLDNSALVPHNSHEMRTHGGRGNQSCPNASHYSLLSSLEVLGKVFFSAISGLLVDFMGVFGSFSLFIVFSFLPILHLWSAPFCLHHA
ncbi:major facilitator superfamily domain-containing protein 3 [Bombina bombina]|uniref:major facilitator superfamily domain-containing protein 3 n=1 Tax=Bombina bombina TaxID=8345 RepID=UPI00235A6D0B|nr:major facilitator superfamily domain-containing protein 3 [Bombina bombina]